MIIDKLRDYKIILASQSPRRSHLLREAGIHFEISPKVEIEESYPFGLTPEEITIYLAELKSNVYSEYLNDSQVILITADTIVWQDNQVIGKPESYQDAWNKLKKLSGDEHVVYTGVCLRTANRKHSFSSKSVVVFDELEDEEITYYLEKYKPYDKAGAYGIQEWIGYIGIKEIQGSFYNVMGLPIHQLYVELKRLING